MKIMRNRDKIQPPFLRLGIMGQGVNTKLPIHALNITKEVCLEPFLKELSHTYPLLSYSELYLRDLSSTTPLLLFKGTYLGQLPPMLTKSL